MLNKGDIRIFIKAGPRASAGTVVRLATRTTPLDGPVRWGTQTPQDGRWIQGYPFDELLLNAYTRAATRGEIARYKDHYEGHSDPKAVQGDGVVRMEKKQREGRRARPSSPPPTGDAATLVAQLKVETDPATKRKIRAQLRKLGHRGGAR